jgi:hypothetical protein
MSRIGSDDAVLSRVRRLQALVVVMLVGCGCSTVAETAAIQKIGVGGGFVALGTLTMTGAVISGGVLALSVAQLPAEQRSGVALGGLLAVGGAAAIGAGETALGVVLMNQGAEVLDAAALKRGGAGKDARSSRGTEAREAPVMPAATTTGPSATPAASDAASPAQARRPMLEGTWQSTGVGPDLKLLSNGRFERGEVRGVWAAARIDETTGTLVLQPTTGKERYRYELVTDTLRLKMEADEQVRTFRRSM